MLFRSRSPEKLLNIDVLRHQQLVHLQVMPQGKRDNMGQVNGVLGVKSDAGKITIPDEYKQTIKYTPILMHIVAVNFFTSQRNL